MGEETWAREGRVWSCTVMISALPLRRHSRGRPQPRWFLLFDLCVNARLPQAVNTHLYALMQQYQLALEDTVAVLLSHLYGPGTNYLTAMEGTCSRHSRRRCPLRSRRSRSSWQLRWLSHGWQPRPGNPSSSSPARQQVVTPQTGNKFSFACVGRGSA